MSFEQDQEKRKERMVDFFLKVNQNYPDAKIKYDLLNKYRREDIDGLYRFYHHSFKMYGELQCYIIDCFSVILSLLGEKFSRDKPFKIESLIKKAEKEDLDEDFIRTVKEALYVKKTTNEDEKWFKDQRILTSAAYHTRIGAESAMHVAENYYKNNKLIAETGFLDEKEALCMYLFNLSGNIHPEEIRKELDKKEKK